MAGSSDFLAAAAHFGEDYVEALLVDKAQPRVGQAHLDPAVLALDPELAVLQVGEVAALGLVVRVGNVVPDDGGFARDLANARHEKTPKRVDEAGKSSIITRNEVAFKLISLGF
jgi:hypothetical protein